MLVFELLTHHIIDFSLHSATVLGSHFLPEREGQCPLRVGYRLTGFSVNAFHKPGTWGQKGVGEACV